MELGTRVRIIRPDDVAEGEDEILDATIGEAGEVVAWPEGVEQEHVTPGYETAVRLDRPESDPMYPVLQMFVPEAAGIAFYREVEVETINTEDTVNA